MVEFGPAFGADHQLDPAHMVEWHCTADGYSECRGITVPAPAGGSGLGTTQTGNAAEEASAQAASSDLGSAMDRTAQAWGGLFVGLGLGLVPGGAVTDQVLSTARAIPEGTRQARIGKAIGEMLGGLFLASSGVTGEVVGTGLTTTGIGSLIGVPAMAVSAALVTSGAGNMAAGLRGLADALLSSGSGSAPPHVAAPAARGGGRLPWGFWKDYPKVIQGGREYAQIGGRLYTEHAVGRMLPSGMGGRGITPSFVEDSIAAGTRSTQLVDGVERTIFTSGNVQVVTEQGGQIVVTVMRLGGM